MFRNEMTASDTYYPLTTQQRGMWNIETVYPDTTVGIISGTVFRKGPLDLGLLERAINLCIQSNDSFGLRMTLQNNEPVQYIAEYHYQSLEHLKFDDQQSLDEWDNANTTKPYTLTNGSLYHFALFQMGEEKWGFYFKLHHLICDAWTIVIMTNQIIDYYNKLSENSTPEPVPMPSYLDFIAKEEEYFSSQTFLNNKQFWDELFESRPKFNILKPYVGLGSIKANRKTFIIPKELTKRVYNFCESYKTTPFTYFISILNLYLSKFTEKDDIVIGSPILNRSNAKDKMTTGMFINIIPMRFGIGGDMSFTGFAECVGKQIRQYLKNQKYPYDLILQDYKKKYQADKIYDVVFSYQNSKLNRDIVSEEYDNHWDFNGYQTESLCIHVDDRNSTGEYVFNFDYLIDAFDEEEIERIYECFSNLIEATVADPDAKLSDLSLLSREQTAHMLFGLNANKVDYPKERLFYQIFEEYAACQPQKTAVICEDQSISYGELNAKANRLARLLRQKGVGPEDLVGIMTDRCVEAITGIFAILKAGGAYLPIDPAYPQDRIRYVVENSGLTVLLTDNPKAGIEYDCDVISLQDIGIWPKDESDLDCVSKPENLMYVIYTSGSTGNPKGVMIENRHFLNIAYGWRKDYKLDQIVVRLLQLASFSFDVFSGDLARVFLNGGTMIIATEDEKYNYAKLARMIEKHRISLFESTPQLVLPLMEHIYGENLDIESLKLLIVGSDTCSNQEFRKLIERFGSQMRVVNSYGVTEATIDSSYYEAKLEDVPTTGSTSIGKPFGNVSLYVLGADLSVKPVGVIGELYLSGDSVGRGYYNNPELTKEKFLENPFVPGQWLYHTGDLAKWLPDGNMAFLGRADTQVKIRGFRIELGEIESKLQAMEGIKDAVVVAHENALYAFYINSWPVETGNIKQYLHNALPHYMVPSYYVELDNFPLSPNGKVDKNALLKQCSSVGHTSEYIAPINDTESTLCLLWEDAIGKGRVGVSDNFFDIGGDSLAAIQILSVAYGHQWKLSIQDFYQYQTIREMAQHIDNKAQDSEADQEGTQYSQVPVLHQISRLSATPDSNQFNNVLLTGATGYLGVHILYELLTTTDATVYCLVRDHGERIAGLLRYYFKDDYAVYMGRRFFLVNGDITLSGLGLSDSDASELSNSIDTVIHSAAIVKHYGSAEEFEKTNVDGTSEIIGFCQKGNKRLLYVSTTSVSGDTLRQTGELSFSENDFYIGQNYRDNIYIKSKFNAENLVLKAACEGLDVTVFRVGNLTGRYADGVFQRNICDSMFYNMLKSILAIGAIPSALLDMELELTPVDLCAKALCSIAQTKESRGRVFHLLNGKLVKLGTLMRLMMKMGYPIAFLDQDTFTTHINGGVPGQNNAALLLVNDYNFEKFVDRHYNVKISSSITNGYLKLLGIDWPEVDEDYLIRIINHIESVGFIRQPALS